MTVEDLRAAVLAVPGVASAEVALREDATPVVRVWTDNSRGDSEIQGDVADVVAIHGYGMGTLQRGRAAMAARITDTLVSSPADEGPWTAKPGSPGLAKLIIEETGDTVVAVASDATGRSARADVGEGADAFLMAVTDAVAALRGVTPAPLLLSVEDRFVAGVDVVSVLIETEVGERYAGAAVVRGGRPFSVGRAVDAALAYSA
jgi:hypothetical protein